MKTKQLFLAILAIVFTANVFATEIPKMNIIPLKDTRTLVAISQNTPAINEISIISEEGTIVYFKQSKKVTTGYKKVFDLSQLEDGTYTVQLKAGTATVKRELEINDGTILVTAQITELDPFFVFDNDVVKVSYLNFEEKDVAVSVFNKGQLIYTSNLGNEFTIHRGINLSKLERGNYNIMLANADNKYWFSVTR
jgi:hypothetical protein